MATHASGNAVIWECAGTVGGAPYVLVDKCGFRESELKDFAWSFRVSDVMGENVVTSKELLRVIRRLGEEPSDSEYLRVLNDIDPHTSGVVDFQKFVRVMSCFHGELPTQDEMIEAFKIFDRDKSGSVDAIELQDVLKKLGFKISSLEAEKMIKEADDDDSGEVTFHEFAKKILQSQ